ncbi:MAG: hypothetical protein HY908_09815, partial [Myxococcales bacterium]|nr:hypothetical protein [Myxococcales bacterium]
PPAPPQDTSRALPRRQRSSATVEIEAPPESTRPAEPLGSGGASGAGSAARTTPAERPPTQRIALEFDPARERARAALAARHGADGTAPPIRAAWLLAAALAVVGTSVAAHYLEPTAIASTAQRLGGSGYVAYVVGSAVLLVGAKLMADASHRKGSLTLWLATVGLVLVAACGGVTAASLAGAEVATLARAARHTAPFAAAAVPLGLSLFGLHEARNELFGPVRRPPFGVLLVVVALAGLGAGARLVQRAPVFDAAASEPRPG